MLLARGSSRYILPMHRLPPLPMRPLFVEKLWGGSRIATLPAKQRAGHAPPLDVAVGESWEVADLPEGQSSVDDHPVCADFAGRTLGSLVREFGHSLVGTRHAADRFPILVKLIDAAEDLSVQVHPGDEYAAAHPGTASKDEAWLVVDSADGARVLHGFVPGVSRELFADAVRKGLPHELMRSVPARRGDVLHVSPGIVHAIGQGALILEVQEPSDTTFRVWDFDRVDASGRKRALHIEQAMAVARFDAQPPALVPRRREGDADVLVATRSFSMRSVPVHGPVARRWDVPMETAQVLYAVDDDVDFAWGEHTITVPRGGSCVLPASCGAIEFPTREGTTRVIVME
jgi:mannose-6-phosphate isomerase